MPGKGKLTLLERRLDRTFKYIGYAFAVASAIGVLAKTVAWLDRGPVQFLGQHILEFWLGAVSAFVMLTLLWVRRLHQRFTMGFSDDFKAALRHNWDYVGPWRITDSRELLVTGSDEGGLTKVGASWENYTLEFRARILQKCLGVVVRAQDLNNYYMFQIKPDRIRPHRRIAVPTIQPRSSSNADDDKAGAPELIPMGYTVGWEVRDDMATEIMPSLSGWFRVRVMVRGEGVHIYINDDLAFQADSYLKFPTGKVGFRNAGSEAALVAGVRVTLRA